MFIRIYTRRIYSSQLLVCALFSLMFSADRRYVLSGALFIFQLGVCALKHSSR